MKNTLDEVWSLAEEFGVSVEFREMSKHTKATYAEGVAMQQLIKFSNTVANKAKAALLKRREYDHPRTPITAPRAPLYAGKTHTPTLGGDDACLCYCGRLVAFQNNTEKSMTQEERAVIDAARKFISDSTHQTRGGNFNALRDAVSYLKGSEIAPGHNPAKLTVAQVGEGWRLLSEEEVMYRVKIDVSKSLEQIHDLEMYCFDVWLSHDIHGCNPDVTYRTQKPEGYFLKSAIEQPVATMYQIGLYEVLFYADKVEIKLPNNLIASLTKEQLNTIIKIAGGGNE